MAHQSPAESDDKIPSQPLDLNSPHPSKDIITSMEQQQEDPSLLLSSNTTSDDRDNKQTTQNPSPSQPLPCNAEKVALQEAEKAMDDVAKETSMAEDSGREKLKQHRSEVAGRVWIPDMWGQEDLLKDWIDCTAFDAPLVSSTITTARTALVEECTRTNAAGLRIENRDLDFNVHMDLSLNNNCPNVEVQNTCKFSDTETST